MIQNPTNKANFQTDKTGQNKSYKQLLIITIIISALFLIFLIASSVGIFYLYDQNTKLTKAVQLTENSVSFQRKQKEQITKIWEEQASRSDSVAFLQIQLINRIEIYQKIITDAFVIKDGKIEKKNDINLSTFKKAEDDYYSVLKDIDKSIDENATKKAEEKQTIDKLYIEADEDQKNRINYIDGIRN